MVNFNTIVEYIKEQFPKSDMIPLHAPIFRGNEKAYLNETIDSTFVSSVGAFVDKFEEYIGKISNSKRGVAVVNGTAALQIALKLVGVAPGDEVLTQALTFVATTNAIKYAGAEPIFIDVDLDTMGLSPKALEAFLQEHAELREGRCINKITQKCISACVPMHTFGFPVHMDELIAVCKKWNIPIVEDAAESLGSTYKGSPCGTLSDIGIYSFNGNKIVTSGGGGAIVSKNEDYIKKGKYLTTTAKVPHPYEYVHDELGYNYRMPNLNAALALAQLEQLDVFLENKRALAMRYKAFFNSNGIKFRDEMPNTKANFWLMCIELTDRNERDEFLKYTNAHGVMTRPIWQLMHKLPMYKDCYRDAQVNAQFLEDRIVNIPSSANL